MLLQGLSRLACLKSKRKRGISGRDVRSIRVSMKRRRLSYVPTRPIHIINESTLKKKTTTNQTQSRVKICYNKKRN
jgi:hypothetical protein